MSAAFEYAFKHTVGAEGGISNHPADRGGLTKFGITHITWAAYCAEVRPMDRRTVDQITLDDAKAVYAYIFWQPLGLDALADSEVAAEIFDTAVNCGLGTAAEIAQRAANLIRPEGGASFALVVDGRMGPVTRRGLNLLIHSGYRLPLLAALNAYQAAHYIAIVEKNPSQRAFIRGWMKRTLVNAKD